MKSEIVSGTEVVAVLVLIVAILTATTTFVFVHGQSDFHKYGSIKKLSNAVDNGNFDDDNINWKSFKSWDGYKQASESIQHCLDKKHSLGNNLGDYEVYDCVD